MTDEAAYKTLTIRLDPALGEMLDRIAADTNTPAEALAVEAISNMVAYIVSGGDEEVTNEDELSNQFRYIQESIEDFEG